jgi:hypothetical protein
LPSGIGFVYMRTSSYFYNIFMGGWIKTNVGSFVQANYNF